MLLQLEWSWYFCEIIFLMNPRHLSQQCIQPTTLRKITHYQNSPTTTKLKTRPPLKTTAWQWLPRSWVESCPLLGMRNCWCDHGNVGSDTASNGVIVIRIQNEKNPGIAKCEHEGDCRNTQEIATTWLSYHTMQHRFFTKSTHWFHDAPENDFEYSSTTENTDACSTRPTEGSGWQHSGFFEVWVCQIPHTLFSCRAKWIYSHIPPLLCPVRFSVYLACAML